MKLAIIVGANNVSIEVARALADKYEVAIIDSDGKACERAYKALKSLAMVYKGDPSSVDALSEVGIDRAELLLALSESDDVNYNVCRIAKERGVPVIIARVNNKDREDLFRELGVTAVINVESLVSERIKSLALSGDVRVLYTDPQTDITIMIMRVRDDSPIIGRQVNYLVENYDVSIPYIVTTSGVMRPGGDHVIEGGVELVIVGTSKNIEKLISEVLAG